MNNKKRIKLKKSCSLLEDALKIVDMVKYDEQDCIDNIPENLRNSDQCTAMEEVVDGLEEAIDNIKQAIENIEDAL